MSEYLGIHIDYSRDNLFDELGIKRLRESYMRDDEQSPQQRFAFVAKQFGSDLAHSQRLYDYASKHWLSFSTPILAFGRTKKGLPISCYLPYLDDTSEGLVNTLSETNWLSMLGGGVGIGLGIRAADDKSTGIMPHLKTYDASCMAYRQGRTRRGSYAVYLNIGHPDIIPFMEMRKPTGDPNQRCLNLHHAVCIPDSFMQIIEKCMTDPDADDSWPLIDPASGEVRETVSARDLWQKLLETRMMTGEPYLLFIDEANRQLPEFQKKLGLQINQSNLCCLTGDVLLTLSYSKDGRDEFSETLGSFVEKYTLGYYSVDLYVKSFDVATQTAEWNLIQGAKYSGDATELYEIQTPSGNSIKCTPEHYIWTVNRNYVMAKDLLETDTLLQASHPVTDLVIRKNTVDSTPVFDIAVDKVNNFFANDVLVHNSEIILATNSQRTAVCCLSSVNLEYFDEWRDSTLFLQDIAEMLDNVLTYFIQTAPKEISRAVFSAQQERSIGVGALGFHAYLQSKGISFESVAAKLANNQQFKHIRTKLDEANLLLGLQRGEAPDAVGTGKRFSHVMAVAPNASTSIIMGNTSPSVEPYRANVYRQDTLSGSFLNKNKYLDKLISTKYPAEDHSEVWSSIIANGGSVQHLDKLTAQEKEIFRTAIEIDQRWVVEHAADRQKYIDQAQSINLFFKPDVNIKYLHAVHFLAWKQKLKTLYYCRSEKIAQADKVSQRIERKRLEEINLQELTEGNACLACEG